MRERLITLACALGALLLFATLFVRGEGLQPRITRPTSVERGANGLRGAFLWLQAEGLHPVALRERFDSLAQRPDLPATGNLLIVTTPVVTPFSVAEATALERWLRAGNTLLVLAALSDSPEWGLGGYVHSDLRLLTGLEFTVRAPEAIEAGEPAAAPAPAPRPSVGHERDDARRADEQRNARSVRVPLQLEQPRRSVAVPNGPHPYLGGVRTVVALSDSTPQSWDVKLPRAGFVMELAHQRDGAGAGTLWLRPYGAGSAVVSAFGSPFTNRALGLADNARLLGSIVGASVASGGAVLFDDEHQGLGLAYDPAKFYRDPRLYTTLGVLGVVSLTRVLGGTRLRLKQVRARAPREAELVRATGLFLARVLRPAAAARRMFEFFFRGLRAPRGSAVQGQPWEWLEQHPRLRPADVQQLREWYAAAYSDQRVPLVRLHNLIVSTERRLSA
ncbi:MAG TPA: DUF4350 domain-containing protein [Steroidobacteraceae bacterium]|nr:DUF4350 domain-containing protein [Steroidobacteraceae bacterium]